MDTKEKLVELIGYEVVPYFTERIADRLIANGVTMQEWISVSKRLPEEMEWVLCTGVDNEVHILRYDYIMDDWDIHNRPNSCHGKGFVTHWMPMPEAPKEG